MSKRKNPLQNLDDFLKQEASSLVIPKKLAEPKPEPVKFVPEKELSTPSPKPSAVTMELVAASIQKLANKNNIPVKQQILELVKFMLEENGLDNSSDKMLLNTILFLQYGDDWREKVAEYWEKTSPSQS